MEKKNYSGGGVDFIGLLTLLFIALKLCGVIDWSWWWVLSPVWITVVVAFIAAVIVAMIREKRGRL